MHLNRKGQNIQEKMQKMTKTKKCQNQNKIKNKKLSTTNKHVKI